MTICDWNQFTTKYGQDFVSSVKNSSECQQNEASFGYCNFWYLADCIATDPFYGDEDRKKIGLNINQIKCTFNNTDCTNDLNWYWSFNYGKCWPKLHK